MNRADYDACYNADFFRRADGYDCWTQGRMRVGDALAAVRYAFGLTDWASLLEGIVGEVNTMRAVGQVDAIRQKAVRQPKRVLDIGAGRGEVAMAFRWLGIPVTAIEPHKDAEDWFKWTWGKLFDGKAHEQDQGCMLMNTQLENVTYIPEDVDTTVMVESLEHIEAAVFDPFWSGMLKPLLVSNHGRLVITNWIHYHPLEANTQEHCRRTDDALYDELAKDGKTVYRNGSHLVVDFA